MEHIQKVFMRLSQCEIQTKCTVVLQKNQSLDSTSIVLGSILMSVSFSNKGKSSKLKHHDINRTYFQEQGRNSLTSDVSVCRTTQRRTSKNECGIV